ncbi:MAG: hypothetical protein AAGK22_16105 [Acidobacteriota bacterium]
MTRFLVLLLGFLLLSWMVQKSLRSLAGRAAQHPLAQLLRLLLGGPAQPGQGMPGSRATEGGAPRKLERCERCGIHVLPERIGRAGGETYCDECVDE